MNASYRKGSARKYPQMYPQISAASVNIDAPGVFLALFLLAAPAHVEP
jgi:hypothetical protein